MAATGEEALELFKTCRPDVTLMDLRLRGMSGVDATRAIRRIDPSARCDLTPWVSAGDVYCRGAAMGPGDMGPPMPPSACACSCIAEYIKAYDAYSQRAQAFANVP